MKLQDILSYRDRCIHCDRALVMRIAKYPKLSINASDTGLKIRSGHKDGVYLNFKFDGLYERNKRDYVIHNGPVFIEKRCNFHPLRALISYKTVPAPIILKSRSVGATTMASAISSHFGSNLDSLKDITCTHEFSLFGDSQGNYDVNLTSEFIYLNDGNEFWHVNTWFDTNKTQIYHGTFEQSIDDIMILKIPAIKLGNVKNKDQLIEKLKLYTLFS